MKKRFFHCSLLLTLALLLSTGTALAQEIAIITHKSNTEKMDLGSLKNYFTGRKTHFSNGQQVLIIDQATGAAARARFLAKVVEMGSGRWDQHWLEQKSKSGMAKPKQTRSVKFILRFISRKPGALGYVNLADLTDKLKGLVRIVATVK